MENALLHQVDAGDQPMDVDFHPTQHLLATAAIDGRLLLHACGRQAAALRHAVRAHDRTSPCRAVRFSLAGDLVLTASTDKSLLAVDIGTGQARARKSNAHDAPINRLAPASETVAASGDDVGVVKLWDTRQAGAVASLHPHTDYVSDLAVCGGQQSLLSVSGDGTLAVADLRTCKLRATSEGDADDDLLAVAVVKRGRKVVCGTASGVLSVWSWGHWEDCSDRFPGHPECVNAIVPYDEDTILTGSSDGLIRVLSVQPNKMLGVLGEHGDLDIERLAASADLSLLASASHDSTVRIWDLSLLGDEGGSDEDNEEEARAANEGGEGAQARAGAGPGASEPPEAAATAQLLRESGAVPQASSGGGDDDSDGARGGRRQRKRRGAHKITGKKQHAHTGGNFFSGLL